MPADVELRRVVIPVSVDAAGAADFVAMVEVTNAVRREIDGDDDAYRTPAEVLPGLQDQPYRRIAIWLVLHRGVPVGRATLFLPTDTASRVAALDVQLLRAAQWRGIGRLAADLVERTATVAGRDVLQVWASHAADGDSLGVQAATGAGRVPRDRAARFLLARGYRLEQVERRSVLAITAPALARIDALRTAAEREASGYRVVCWDAPAPGSFVSGYAAMKAQMVVDEPDGALQVDEEVWDSARVAEHERSFLAAGRRLHVTAAQCIADGELVAFTELAGSADPHAATEQRETFVRAGHRGHRLGMLIKCTGLLAWHELVPGSPRVSTHNAEENTPMLAINDAMGFVPVTYRGAWQKGVDV